MSWENHSFKNPRVVELIHSTTRDIFTQSLSELDILKQQLGLLNSNISTSSTAKNADAISTAVRSQLNSITESSSHSLVVHPYQFTVGQGENLYLHLSVPNLMTKVSEKLVDINDDHLPDYAELKSLFCCFVSGSNLNQFLNNLNILNSIFLLPELSMVQRRVRYLIKFEKTKFDIKSPIIYPKWKRQNLNSMNPVSAARNSLDLSVGYCEAYASEVISPENELAAIIKKKQQQARSQLSGINDLTALLNGDSGFSFYAESTSINVLRQMFINSTGLPGHEHTLSAAIVLLAPTPQLLFFKELVNR